MCGILGHSNISQSAPEKLQPVLRHRGPDGFGTFQDEFLTMIHWRLAIIDLSDSAAQPFFFEQLVLIYNGEVYNYREIGVELEKHGYRLSTQSDTEVVLKAFHCWGPSAVNRFTGIFAFAVYNRESREIWLFRDRLGVKPLYYSLAEGFSFGSEMKVFRALGKKLTIDRLAMRQYFRFGFNPGERTIFKEVRKVPPGHYVKYAGATATVHRYWTIPDPTEDFSGNTLEVTERVLTKAFTYRMVSDVPVGVFLSGGIDSSLVATLLQRSLGKPLKTYTIGFDEEKFDESPFARQVASRLGTDHTEFRLNRSAAKERLLKFYDIYDEPFGDSSGIPTTLVASLARQQGVKVVLSAEGGDEFFGGYPHYRRIVNLAGGVKVMPTPLRHGLAKLLHRLHEHWPESLHNGNIRHRLDAAGDRLGNDDIVSLFEASISNQTRSEIDALLGEPAHVPALLRDDPSMHPMAVMMLWDASCFLPDDLLLKVDRATMSQGVENRDPFLDHHLVEHAQRLRVSDKISGRTTKAVLRKILYQYHPAELFDRPKQGFSIPLFSWFSKELDDLFQSCLREPYISDAGLQVEVVRAEMRKYAWCKKRGKEYNMEKMWRILSFIMWHIRWGR